MNKYVKPPYILKQTFLGPQKCPSCKRPAKKVTTRVYSNEPYNGNMVLVRSIDQWKREGMKKQYERNSSPIPIGISVMNILSGTEKPTFRIMVSFALSLARFITQTINSLTEHLGVEYKDMPEGVDHESTTFHEKGPP